MSESYSLYADDALLPLLAQYQQNLALLSQQAATQGSGQESLPTLNQIEAQKHTIESLRAEIQRRGLAAVAQPAVAPAASSATPTLGQGLAALIQLMQVPEVYAAVESYGDTFQFARQQISALKDFKSQHDLLHKLQFQCYDLLVRSAAEIPSRPAAWDDLNDCDIDLCDLVAQLHEVGAHASPGQQSLAWIDDVSQMSADLSSAIEKTDAAVLKRVIWRMKRLLDLQPSYINADLNNTAKILSQSGVGQKMQRLLDRLHQIELDPQLLGQFEAGVQALNELGPRLSELVDDHNAWQLVDRELRRIEAELDRDTSDLEFSWPELRGQVDPLCCDDTERWATSIKRYADRLNGALVDHDVAKAGVEFRRYRREICNQFYRVDSTLMDVCNKLGEFRNPLADLQRMLG